MDSRSVTQTDHRDEAECLADAALDRGLSAAEAGLNLQMAQVHATLAQAEAIDRLTAAIERLEFPTLEVKKCIGSLGGFSVRPKR